MDKYDEKELSKLTKDVDNTQRVQNFATHCQMVAYAGANQRNHPKEQPAVPYANPWRLQSSTIGDLEVISDLIVQTNLIPL